MLRAENQSGLTCGNTFPTYLGVLVVIEIFVIFTHLPLEFASWIFQ